jgi:tetratricopeptide (TPR) repeat protein
MLAISIVFMSDLNAKFAKGPADWISTLILVLSATLAFLQGGFLVKAVGDLAASNRVLDDGLARFLIGVALFVLLGVVAVDRMTLPLIARQVYYPSYPPPPGVQPIDMYQRATSLDPNFQGAYYRLGMAFEDTGDLSQALSNYQIANRLNTMAADVQPVAPIVSWTWALARSGNFAAALPPLEVGFQRLGQLDTSIAQTASLDQNKQQWRDENQATRYQLYINRAWAYLGLNLLQLAKADAQQALSKSLYPDGVAPHCLLAQIEEGLAEQAKDPDFEKAGLADWRICVTKDEYPWQKIEPRWLAMGRERLLRFGTK